MRSLITVFFVLWMSVGVQAQQKLFKIVALGDSLTAGYGLAAGQSVPDKLQAMLGNTALISNAGVSGDTTTGGLARLEWSVPPDTDIVILALGANDALRGVSPDITRKNLETIIERLKARNVTILLVGMLSPRNLDETFRRDYDALFPELAARHGLIFEPFYLEGVAGNPQLNLPDGIHPNDTGTSVIASRLFLRLEQAIKSRN
jgi:acyl-CoA thioesterase I